VDSLASGSFARSQIYRRQQVTIIQRPFPDFMRLTARAAKKAAIAMLVGAGLLVDVFAGFGGGSIASERAHGRPVDIAINHWASAIEYHARNHPLPTRHLTADVWEVDPEEATAGMPVLHAHFSPDCRHFSGAKGGSPVSDGVRALPWVVLRWAKNARPSLITLENVKEFLTWGPTVPVVIRGKFQYWPDGTQKRIPDPNKKGVTFKIWVGRLRALGYEVDWKILDAADYGAPTHRRRLFLVARCDGKPVVWPKPTHGAGREKPYRTAAECIYFDRPCPSIFMDRAQALQFKHETGIRCNRPLRRKTLWRVANGVLRFVIQSAKPFIISTAYSKSTGRGKYIYPPEEPLRTITSSNDKAVVAPALAKYYGQGTGQTVDQPIHTVTTKDRFGLIAANMVRANHGGDEFRGQSLEQPLGTVTTKHGTGITASHLVKFRGDNLGVTIDGPMPTITAGQGAKRDAGAAHALGMASAVLVEVQNASSKGGSRAVDRPSPTIMANPKGGGWALADVKMVPFVAGCGGRAGQSLPTAGNAPIGTITGKNDRSLGLAMLKHYGGVTGMVVENPLGTITTVDHHGLVAAHLTHFHSEKAGETRASDLSSPLPTQDTSNRFGVAAAFLAKLRGSGGWRPCDLPLDTICAGAPTFGVVAAFITKWYGTAIGADLLKPLSTATAGAGGGHLGAVHAFLSDGVDAASLAGFWRVYAFLLEHLGKDAPLPLVQVDGHLYLIVDIGLRMLEPRELLNAQFTPELAANYVLPQNKALAVKLIGNSVSPPVLEAVIRAQGVGRHVHSPKQKRRVAA
jgi:DNA (cytosine-5)-methyltransferase 1